MAPYFNSLYRSFLPCLAVVLLLTLISCSGPSRVDSRDLLTPEERSWLIQHKGQIRFAPSPNYPPIGFVDKDGIFKGITAEYVRLLEEKLQTKFEWVYCESWDEILQKAERREVDIIGNIQDTPRRREYLLFTPPYLTIPNVIVVRNDFNGDLVLDSMAGMRAAIVQGYATINYLEQRQPELGVKTVKDTPEGLQMVSFGRVDAFITDLGVASYFIDRLGITNLRIAGDIGFDWHLSFASRKDYPILNQILIKGLASIPQKERQKIHNAHIHLNRESDHWWPLIMIGLMIVLTVIGLTALWNISLKRQVASHTRQLEIELEERKKVEERLKMEKEFTTAALDAQLDTFFLFDPETGKAIRWNKTFRDLTGYSDEEIADLKAPQAYYSPEDLERADRFIKKILSNRRGTIELELICKNGRKIPTEYSVAAIYNNEKKPRYLISVGRDLTWHKRTERELKKNKQLLSFHLENTPVGAISWNLNFRVTDWNKAAEKIFGYPKHEALGKHPAELILPPEIKENINNVFQMILSDTGGWTNTNENITKDGRRIICDWYNTVLKDPEGKTIGAASFVTDVSERIHTEKKLQRERDAAQKYLDIAGVIFLAIDNDGKITLINKKGCELLGYAYEEIIGKNWFTHFIPEWLREEILSVSQDVKQGLLTPSEYYENPVLTRSGEERLIAWHNTILTDDRGNVTGHLSSGEDVTEKRRLEAQLHHSQKMEAIGTLAGGIAHDFNNMLSVLMGNTSYALSMIDKDDELFDILSDVVEAAQNAQTLTHQLLTFAKGGVPIKKTCNINALIVESAIFVTRGTPSLCDFNLSQDVLSAEVDAGQINQVISNIVINAHHAMPDGGKISISSENIEIEADNPFQLAPGPYIKISIEDQGIGIQEKHIDNIFDPYFTTKQKGSGLGLASAYSIVKRHNGHITVYSEVGKGTVFNLYLPASGKPIEERPAQKRTTHRGHGRILVMDDQESILKMVVRMLTRMGYKTESVTDGAKAVELYRHMYTQGTPFDLVILDLTVPGGMGGQKTISELLTIDPNVKAVVSSGYCNDPVMAHYTDYGFCGVVPKPYTKARLAELLNQIIDAEE